MSFQKWDALALNLFSKSVALIVDLLDSGEIICLLDLNSLNGVGRATFMKQMIGSLARMQSAVCSQSCL